MWHFLYIQKSFNDQTWEDDRQAGTDVILQVTKFSSPLSHLKNIHNFISPFLTPISTKLGTIVEQYTLTFACMMTSILLGYVANNYDFVYNFLSHTTNTFGRTGDQHAFALASKWWQSLYHRIIWLRRSNLLLKPWWWLYCQLLTNILVCWSTTLPTFGI